MKKYCGYCKKRVFFWNRFYRKFGLAVVYTKNYKYLGKTTFCSDACHNNAIGKCRPDMVALTLPANPKEQGGGVLNEFS